MRTFTEEETRANKDYGILQQVPLEHYQIMVLFHNGKDVAYAFRPRGIRFREDGLKAEFAYRVFDITSDEKILLVRQVRSPLELETVREGFLFNVRKYGVYN